jgi:hypothetical protein
MGHSKRTKQGKKGHQKQTKRNKKQIQKSYDDIPFESYWEPSYAMFQTFERLLSTWEANCDSIPRMISILTAYEKSHHMHGDADNQISTQGVVVSNTPSSIPNPPYRDLKELSTYISLATDYVPKNIPLQKCLGSADYTLSVKPVYTESLNQTQPDGPKPYHYILRTTRLHQTTSTITLRTVALGRICYKGQPTFWFLAWELRGNLFALRSDTVAPDELLFEDLDDDDLDTPDVETIPAVLLPEFDKLSSKAVYLGKTALLGGDKVLGALATEDGYQVLQVTGWDSELVSA